MSVNTLSQSPRIHPELKPPEGAVPAGVTHDGKHNLYKRTRPMVVDKVPLLDEDGKRVTRKNRLTGEDIILRNKPVVEEVTDMFYLVDQGNGQIEMMPYTPPTPEELAAKAREEKIDQTSRQLSEALVDQDVDVADLIGAIKGRKAPPEAEKDASEGEKSYPDMYGPGLWHLSAEHEAACQAGHEKGFRGNGEEAAAEAERRAEVATVQSGVPEV